MRRLLAGLCAVGLLTGSAGAVVSEMTPPPKEVVGENMPTADYIASADVLYELGLFQGAGVDRFGRPVYELEGPCTRAEAAVMLVRLLGLEEEAKEAAGTPFTDLQDWQKPYVNLLYHRGMIRGASYDKFDPESPCTAQMYTALMLRALGYSDQAGDFTYDNALSFGMRIGLIDNFSCDLDDFRRDDAAQMSRMALELKPKGSETDLLGKLVQDGAVDAKKAESVHAETAQITALTDRVQASAPYQSEVFAAVLDDGKGNSMSLHGTLINEESRSRLDGMLSIALNGGHSVSQQVIVLRDSSGISISPWTAGDYRDDQVAAFLRDVNILSLVMTPMPARSLIGDITQKGQTYTMTLSEGAAQLTFDDKGIPGISSLYMTLHDVMYSVSTETVKTTDVPAFSLPSGYSSYIKISNTP